MYALDVNKIKVLNPAKLYHKREWWLYGGQLLPIVQVGVNAI
jgi:hypothetical protein